MWVRRSELANLVPEAIKQQIRAMEQELLTIERIRGECVKFDFPVYYSATPAPARLTLLPAEYAEALSRREAELNGRLARQREQLNKLEEP